MTRKNILFTVLLASVVGITAQGRQRYDLSRNERAVFLNFYAHLEALLTNLQLGCSAESLEFVFKGIRANVLKRYRDDFERKWNFVAQKKNLSLKRDRLYKECLKNSSSLTGKKKCEMLMTRHLNNIKENLLHELVKAKKQGKTICNKMKVVPRRRRR